MAYPQDVIPRLEALAATYLAAAEKATAKGDHQTAAMAIFALECATKAMIAQRALDTPPPVIKPN